MTNNLNFFYKSDGVELDLETTSFNQAVQIVFDKLSPVDVYACKEAGDSWFDNSPILIRRRIDDVTIGALIRKNES